MILVVVGETTESPDAHCFQKLFKEQFKDLRDIPIACEDLNENRFPGVEHRELFAEYLRCKYSQSRVEIVVTVLYSALSLILDYRNRLFPGTPIVHGAVPAENLRNRVLPSDVYGHLASYPIERVIRLALELQPKLKEFFIVAGTAPVDQFWANEAQNIAKRFSRPLRFSFIGTGPIEQTLSIVRSLRSNSAIIFLSLHADGDKRAFINAEISKRIIQESHVPVYSPNQVMMNQGAAGCGALDFNEVGKDTGLLCRSILQGQIPRSSLDPETPAMIVNVQALKRWGLSPAHIPSEARRTFEIEARFDSLSRRERDVLDLLYDGKTNKQIASDLGLVERTIKHYRASIMHKLRVESFAKLIRIVDNLRILTF